MTTVANDLINRPEARLLVCCSRSDLTDDLAAEIKALVEANIDWATVTEVATRHRVTPLVLRQITRAAPELLALPELSPLIAACHSIARHNLHITHELLQLLDVFESEGIAAIPLKGPMLAVTGFGDLAWREFGDLDILIDPHDIPKAKSLMASRGFRPQRELTRAQEAAYVHSEHAFHYTRNRDHLPVEIHWRLEDHYLAFHFDTRELWRSHHFGQLFGKRVRCLSSEHLILYLCMHGAKHYWERLEWICCLSAVIRANPTVQWSVIVEEAAKLGGIRIIQLGVLLVNRLEGNTAAWWPAELIKPDHAANELADRAWRSLFTEELVGSKRDMYRFHFYLSARERLRDRLSVVGLESVRIPHPDSSMWRHFPLPSGLLFLYYFLGPLRLLGKCRFRGLIGC